MPLWKCKNCQHEWEGQFNEPCDWCGSVEVRVLQKKTSFEAYVEDERFFGTHIREAIKILKR